MGESERSLTILIHGTHYLYVQHIRIMKSLMIVEHNNHECTEMISVITKMDQY